MQEDLVTHVRLRMYPDGGIARFRLYGRAQGSFPAGLFTDVELSAAVLGAVATRCSDEHFGRRGHLLLPGRGRDMGDGWETRRSRAPGHVDWVVVRLAARGELRRVVVDTKFFLGNYPKRVRLAAADVVPVHGPGRGRAQAQTWADADADEEDEVAEKEWVDVLSEQPLGPGQEHVFDTSALRNVDARGYTHVRMTIVPDGGVGRLRVFGRPT